MEIWKDIPGYEGRYQASTYGNIRSVDRYVRVVPHGTETVRLAKGKVLRPGPIGKYGHMSVALGQGNSQMVHAMVMLTFVGPRPHGLDVAHLNGVGSDNRLENLKYATRSENNIHITLHGKRPLTPAQILYIRRLAAKGFKRGDKSRLADELGVSRTTISSVLVGRHYAHIQES